MVCSNRLPWAFHLGVSIVVAAMAAVAVVVGVPTPAFAEPGPGTITATFTDLCGFVRADFSSGDPVVTAQIRYSRDGVPLTAWTGSVPAGGSESLYQVAVAGDPVRFEWDVTGGSESLEHVHATPAGCDEPNLSVGLDDDCGTEFTIVVTNSGKAPAEVLLWAPSIHTLEPFAVPVGGLEVTVPGVLGTSVLVSRYRPGGTDPNADLAEIATVTRAPGCGIPVPAESTATFTPAADHVAILFYPVNRKGLLRVYVNGGQVLSVPVSSGDIYRWTVPAACGDVVTIDDPATATYTHRPPACPSPSSTPPPVAGGPVNGPARGATAGVAPPVTRLIPPAAVVRAAVGTPTPAATENLPTNESVVPKTSGQPGSTSTDAVPVARARAAGLTVTAGVGVLVVLMGLAALALRRHRTRPLVVTTARFRGPDAVPTMVETGTPPNLSLRLMARTQSGTVTLQEAAT